MSITLEEATKIACSIDLPFGYKVDNMYWTADGTEGAGAFRVTLAIPSLPNTYAEGKLMEGFTFIRNIPDCSTAEEFLQEFTTLVMLAVCHEVFEKCSKAGTQMMDPHPSFGPSIHSFDGQQLEAFWNIQGQILREFVEGMAAISPPHLPVCKLCTTFYVVEGADICKHCHTSHVMREIAHEEGLIMVPLEMLPT
jgi:hypothetical protein